jgi:hypothetical protein
MKKLFILILALPLPLFLFAFHNHEEKEHNEHISVLENFLNSTENKLHYVYTSLNEASKKLDETLSGEKSPYTYEESLVHFQFSYEAIEDQSNDTDIDLKVRIKLPQLRNKVKLILENQDNKVAKEEYKDSNETVPYEDDKFNLELVRDSLKKSINFKTKIGAKLSSDPYLFVSAQAGKKFPLTNSWRLELKEKLRLSTKKSLENTTTMNFHKYINGRIRFLNHNEYYWNEKDRENNLYNSLRVHQKISRRNILNYVSSLSSDDDSDNMKTKRYTTYVSYKHYIRKWLYYDLVPRVYWDKSNDFDSKYAFKINVGVIIGK